MKKRAQKKHYYFGGVFVLLALVVLVPVGLMVFAGHTTKAFRICEKMKEVVIDMDRPELIGHYSFRVSPWETHLELSGENAAYGCIDNSSDSMADQCLQYQGMIDPRPMTGEWELVADGLYIDPYGIHIGPGSKMRFIGMRQGELVVYVALFTLDRVLDSHQRPAHQVLTDSSSEIEVWRRVLCDH